MHKVFHMYKLRPTATAEAYREFSLGLDQPVTRRQPGVERFEVYTIEGGEHPDAFSIVEELEVSSWDAWFKVVRSEPMKPVGERWRELVDPSTAVHVYGTKLV